MAGGSTGHIIQSLVANTLIGISKGVAAVITGSGAMLAETIHSFADCGNQLLLLLGVKQGQKPADARHPLGYGRAVYFWSFMVALLLFIGGGGFSIYEGIHKLQHPEKPEDPTVALIVLGIAIAIEGWATISNIRELDKRRGSIPFVKYLRSTKDSDLVVVFGENAAATLGLILALIFILIAHQTGDGRWDAIGSLSIGVVLIAVALFLAVEVKALLMGESADPKVEAAAREIAVSMSEIEEILFLVTVQQGPGEAVVAMKVRMKSGLETGGQLCKVINDFEERLRTQCPEAKWIFVEPDVAR
jgi:cation diffusion facilitator family transporter